MNEKTTKILIVRLSALGDTIHTIPAVKALREVFRNSRIDWIVEEKASYPLINNPLVDNLYVIRKKGKPGFREEFFGLIKKIRAEKYDIAIDMQQLFKSASIMFLSGAKRKVALDGGREFSGLFANEIIKTGTKQFDIKRHVVERNLDVARYFGAKNPLPEFVLPEVAPETVTKINNLLADCDPSKKTLIIAPETTWAAKHAPDDFWRNLTDFALKKNCNVVYSGVNPDVYARIFSENPGIVNLCGKTSVTDLFELFGHADILVTPDSGSAHVAWACGKCKIISLFFATSALRTAPYGSPKYASVSSKSTCSPCMKKKCRFSGFRKNSCVNNFSEKEVFDFFEKML